MLLIHSNSLKIVKQMCPLYSIRNFSLIIIHNALVNVKCTLVVLELIQYDFFFICILQLISFAGFNSEFDFMFQIQCTLLPFFFVKENTKSIFNNSSEFSEIKLLFYFKKSLKFLTDCFRADEPEEYKDISPKIQDHVIQFLLL